MALDKNSLEKFSSYNYIWFMDVATRDELRSSAYKNKKGRIIRSDGIANTAGANLQTLDERNLGVKGEYFIDNVSIQSYVSPNPYSGIANATKVDFSVTEPYSIGLFLQTLELAAREAGYKNYLEAPFVLGVEFIGYDSNGVISNIDKRVLLIKIVKATFNVTSAGSVYQVQSIPWNHQALLDQFDNIPVNISIRGDTVEEILTSLAEGGVTDVIGTAEVPSGRVEVITGSEVTGTRSLVKALNDHESTEIEAKGGGTNITATQYEILFPSELNFPRGSKNEIATQKIAENFSDLGNQDLGLPEKIYDQLTALYQRRNLEISENGRVYQFRQGTKIETIIEEVILTSEWSKNIIEKKPDNNGFIDWFKILTFVDILDGDTDRFGNLPKKYTFVVYPYKIHISALTSTTQTVNYNTNIVNAVRGYSYSYTGQNTDVIDFNINIDYAWIQAISNLNQTSQSLKDKGSSVKIKEEPASVINQDPSSSNESLRSNKAMTTDTNSNSGGNNKDDEQTRAARAFNDAIINSNADLIKLNMTIWGDPYYLADTDYGGYIAQRRVPNQSADGAMDHLRSEIDVLINFAGSVDYKNDLLTPTNARQFIGVYKVIRVNSTFENGMFKQELELIRRRNPDPATIDNVINALRAKETGRQPFIQPATSGVNSSDLKLFLRQAEETELLFNIFGQLKLQEISSSTSITPFALISQLSRFSQLFDQARQIRSAIGNLGSLAGNINLSNLNKSSLQQLTQQLTSAQDFFTNAFSQVNALSITQALNQDFTNSTGQLIGPLTQITGSLVQTATSNTVTKITSSGVQNENIPTSPSLPGLSSILKPKPRPQQLNPTNTRLIDTPAGPKRVVVGASSRNQTSASTTSRPTRPGQNVSGQITSTQQENRR
jgi:hypothetical protein